MQYETDYNKWAKSYIFPYRDLGSRDRIKALEERLFTNEWALNEVRATRELQDKLSNTMIALLKDAHDIIVNNLPSHAECATIQRIKSFLKD